MSVAELQLFQQDLSRVIHPKEIFTPNRMSDSPKHTLALLHGWSNLVLQRIFIMARKCYGCRSPPMQKHLNMKSHTVPAQHTALDKAPSHGADHSLHHFSFKSLVGCAAIQSLMQQQTLQLRTLNPKLTFHYAIQLFSPPLPEPGQLSAELTCPGQSDLWPASHWTAARGACSLGRERSRWRPSAPAAHPPRCRSAGR